MLCGLRLNLALCAWAATSVLSLQHGLVAWRCSSSRRPGCQLSPRSMQVLSRLEVIPGDLAQDHCGLRAEDEQRLLREVESVLHVAASIQFDNSIHTDLTLSYVATRSLADMAAQAGAAQHLHVGHRGCL